jgi:hypothetical protein
MDPSLVAEFSQFVRTVFVPSLKSLFPVEGSITDALWAEEGEGPLEFMKGLRAKTFLISKSGPVLGPYNVTSSPQNTAPASILASAQAWRYSYLYPVLENWCKMTGNQGVLNRIGDWTKHVLDWEFTLPLSPKGVTSPWEYNGWLGKLGFKPEPAGKVRVFAMVDPWTQWLLDPLHRAIFKLLQAIPQDGTHDQLKPIGTLITWAKAQREKSRRAPPLFSFDLSAATDRIPLTLQKVLLSPFLTAWGAETWGQLMVGRRYACPNQIKLGKTKQVLLPKGEDSVVYGTGQPMGALSSWANLALIHHAIVQWAAHKAGVLRLYKGWYPGYAILGDDVVISGAAVATQYRALMKRAGVEISGHKTLESRSGRALEFAKRTFLNGEDVSMAPMAEFIAATQNISGLLELIRKYSLSLGTVMSCLGYGYRAKANASKRLISLPRRLRNYLISFYGPGGPFYAGMKPWLAMRSLTSVYKTAMERVPDLVVKFAEREVKLLLERIESLAPLVQKAKELGTVHRDREHYGTIKRTATGSHIQNPEPKEEQISFVCPAAPRQTAIHGGIEISVPQSIVDSLNETVYRAAFLKVVVSVRDLRTKLEETAPASLDWEGLEQLWATIRDIESELGSLPFPKNFQVRVQGKPSTEQKKLLDRWYAYSGAFRATVTRSGSVNTKG